MKILIQNSRTEEFLRVDSLWTTNVNMAMDFLSTLKATHFGLKQLDHSFRVVEIETTGLFTVPVPASYHFSREYIPWQTSGHFQSPVQGVPTQLAQVQPQLLG